MFWVADRGQSPYVAAKAMVIAAPLVMTLALGALPCRPWRWRDGAGVARVVLVALFGVSAAYSTSLALRAAPVASGAAERELGALRPLLGSRPTLFLGNDDHVGWWLRDVRLGYPLASAADRRSRSRCGRRSRPRRASPSTSTRSPPRRSTASRT